MDAAKEQPKPEEAQKQERGFGRGDRKPRGDKKGKGERKKDEVIWNPVTKLGRLVKAGKIDNIVDIFRFSIPIKESEIVDKFFGEQLKEEVMAQYIGLGWKCHK